MLYFALYFARYNIQGPRIHRPREGPTLRRSENPFLRPIVRLVNEVIPVSRKVERYERRRAEGRIALPPRIVGGIFFLDLDGADAPSLVGAVAREVALLPALETATGLSVCFLLPFSGRLSNRGAGIYRVVISWRGVGSSRIGARVGATLAFSCYWCVSKRIALGVDSIFACTAP